MARPTWIVGAVVNVVRFFFFSFFLLPFDASVAWQACSRARHGSHHE